MASLWINSIVIWCLVSWSLVSTQSEDASHTPQAKDDVDCMFTPQPESVPYVPSKIPQLKCTCAWAKDSPHKQYAEWTLENAAELNGTVLLNTTFRTSNNLMKSTAVLTIMPSSKIHSGELETLVLSYQVPGFVEKSDKIFIHVKKSHYHGFCREDGDCNVTNSYCLISDCSCRTGFSNVDVYTCNPTSGAVYFKGGFGWMLTAIVVILKTFSLKLIT